MAKAKENQTKPLTPKQQRFCEEYLIDRNATQAAIRAGYSKRSAFVQGSHLLSNDKIKAEVQTQSQKIAEKCEVTVEDNLKKLLEIASVDVASIFKEDGSLKAVEDIPEDVRRAISGIDVTKEFNRKNLTGYTKKIRFWDKVKALELIGKHLQMFTDVVKTDQVINVIIKKH